MDCIQESLIDSTRTRRQIIRQLILMDLVTNSKQLKRGLNARGGSGAGGREAAWSEEQVEQLKNLYDLHRDDRGESRS